MSDPGESGAASPALDPEERAAALLRDLRSSRAGLTAREVERRLVRFGDAAGTVPVDDRRHGPL
jgi:hypothetical protein